MPLIKSRSKAALQKNIETEMEAHPSKEKRAQNLAIAYATQRRAKKMAAGGMAHEHSEDCYSHGGPVCKYGYDSDDVPGAEDATGLSAQDNDMSHPHTISAMEEAHNEASTAKMIRKERQREALAKGGKVGDPYKFDINDELEHPEYWDTMNEDMANAKLYDDTYGPDPTDSNEKGDKLSDADEHGKSLFKKIKMKRAQPGDRGKY